jgi:hypothetical protein
MHVCVSFCSECLVGVYEIAVMINCESSAKILTHRPE